MEMVSEVNLKTLRSFWDHLGLFGTIWDNLGSFGIIWDHLGLFLLLNVKLWQTSLCLGNQFYDNFEFKAKIGQKWPRRAPNDQNWPESLKSDIRNHLHWISASLAVILSGHMTSLQQF